VEVCFRSLQVVGAPAVFSGASEALLEEETKDAYPADEVSTHRRCIIFMMKERVTWATTSCRCDLSELREDCTDLSNRQRYQGILCGYYTQTGEVFVNFWTELTRGTRGVVLSSVYVYIVWTHRVASSLSDYGRMQSAQISCTCRAS